jgi:hypothetical protein
LKRVTTTNTQRPCLHTRLRRGDVAGKVNITSERTLKLERVENGVAYINITGVIVNDKANMNVAGQQVNISFDGGEDGYINIDINTGLIVKSKISAKGEGSITVMNRSVPLTFKSTTEISKKK